MTFLVTFVLFYKLNTIYWDILSLQYSLFTFVFKPQSTQLHKFAGFVSVYMCVVSDSTMESQENLCTNVLLLVVWFIIIGLTSEP